ncbi:YkgJ family cysteine cluster protein [Arenimonas sp. GDDSR-1]|uniref:YkgJ family cysteine cluster protein n=1 Tax=Arenimonas sp. GDDSR-1 TaxID=2950125 RepID=UPI0026300193|nr:YkgJ family cysteine cluster protein [Arenimonas sp. GDDSR-1]
MNADSADPTTFDCTTCGACCASFRVSFYWAEGAANGLPENLTERLNDRFSCMAGTNSSAPRCVALQGRIGESAACSVYDQRSSTCREVQPGDAQCRKARLRHGLSPLGA